MDKITKILITSFILFVFNTEYFHSTNEFSRFYMSVAVVEKGSFIIDEYFEIFPDYLHDKSFIDGHYYSDKAPGPSMIAVPIYFLIKQFGLNFEIGVSSENAGIIGIDTSREVVNRMFVAEFLIAVLSVCILSALIVGMLYNILLSINERYALLLTLSYLIGTSSLVYSSSFFDVQFLTFFSMFPFYISFRRKREDIGKRLSLIIGSFIGIGILCSYYAFIPLVIILIYTSSKIERRNLALVVIPIMISFSVMLCYNSIVTGNPFIAPYAFHSYFPGAEQNYGMRFPSIFVLFDFLFGSQGYLLLSPILLLPLISLFFKNERFKKERRLVLSLVLFSLLFFSTFVGGAHDRFLVFLTPFMIISLSWNFEKVSRLFWPLLLLSILLVASYSLTSGYSGFSSILQGFESFVSGNIENIISSIFAVYGIKVGYFSFLVLIPLIFLWYDEIKTTKKNLIFSKKIFQN